MTFHKTQLKNGVRIISERVEHLSSVSLGIWVNAGSRDELEQENGISHFIEHMIFRGTANRSNLQIAKELDAIGGMSNAFTGKENTCFYARVLGKDFQVLSDILSDIFLHSNFDPEDLERERQVILQEISMVEDTPDDNIHVLFTKLFWPDHPIGLPILGTEPSIASIDKEAISDYIRKSYVPGRILVSAAGNIDHRQCVSYFEPLFESLPANGAGPSRIAPGAHAGVSIHYKDLEQVQLCLGGKAPSLKNEDRFAAAIFNTLLGGNMSSRLFQEIREKRGLAYSVYSFLSSYADAGLLGIYAATDSQNVNPALEIIQAEIRKCKEGEITAADLEAAKDHLVGGIYLSSESADNRMMRNSKNEFLFERYVPLEELSENLKRVTLDGVVRVASEIFQGDQVSLATLGPLAEKEVDLGLLRFD
jgi:predicted Zn-dependent peptidase